MLSAIAAMRGMEGDEGEKQLTWSDFLKFNYHL